LVQGNQRWSYAELQEATDRLAQALREDGCYGGEHLALVLGNSVAFVLAYLAGMKAGGIVVPLNPGTPPKTLAKLLQDCSPLVAVVEPRHGALLEPLRARVPGLRRAYIAGTDAAPPMA
jgi:acyl-CoA synthetase (AMP-forming)/AMP-acid ligase II